MLLIYTASISLFLSFHPSYSIRSIFLESWVFSQAFLTHWLLCPLILLWKHAVQSGLEKRSFSSQAKACRESFFYSCNALLTAFLSTIDSRYRTLPQPTLYSPLRIVSSRLRCKSEGILLITINPSLLAISSTSGT